MIDLADEEQIFGVRLHLGMTSQAKIVVRLDQQLSIDRPVRTVADSATLPHSFMFENKRTGLFAMALSARLIQPSHGQPPSWLHDVASVRVVALHAVHAPFHHRMMPGKVELGLGLEMAIEANRGIFAGINDGFSAPGRLEMFARGPMTGFAAGKTGPFHIILVETRVRTVGKKTRNISVAIDARLVAHERGSLNFRRRHDRSVHG